MAESLAHISYVRKIVEYMAKAINNCQLPLIQADLAEYGKRTPQVIGGFYPDVYYRTPNTIVIGEAKTDDDIDRKHTDEQINSYIMEARTATNHQRHIILATSIYSFAMWKNKIVRLKKQNNLSDITFHIIDNISHFAMV